MNDEKTTNTLQISQETSPVLPYVSDIELGDKVLLEKTVQRFRPHSKNYEDSWGYVIQATRYGGFKWYDTTTGYLIFFGRKSPTDLSLIVATYFAEPEYLTYVVNRIQKIFGSPQTILKNVSLEDVETYLQYGFRHYLQTEFWCQTAQFDDQTFPQQIIDLKKLIEAKGTDYRPLRKALRKTPTVSIKNYDLSHKETILKIFALKDSNSLNPLEKLKNIYFESHKMYPTANLDKFVIVDNQTDKILGFTATSDISPKITALVASLFRPDAKNVGVWSMYQTLLIKYRQGIQFASLGGCEFKSTYKFKREKFRPIEEHAKTHLVYDL